MAKNDYFVLVYRVLSYFYECVKAGEKPERDMFSPDALNINNSYWVYIMENMVNEGYIRGVTIFDGLSGIKGAKLIEPQITQKGIAFLEENSMMAKAKDALKTIKEIVPGI